MNILGAVFGMKVVVVPGFTFHFETIWRPLPLGQLPPGASPRAHSRRRRWMVGEQVKVWDDPGDQILNAGNTIYCTPRQYETLKRYAGEAA